MLNLNGYFVYMITRLPPVAILIKMCPNPLKFKKQYEVLIFFKTTSKGATARIYFELKYIFSCRRSRADLVVSIGVLLLLLHVHVHVLVLEPLPLLSEQSLFWLFRLSGDFSLGGTVSFGALYPMGHFTLWGPLPLGSFCPQGPFALHDLLLFGSFRLFRTFGFFSYCRQMGLKGLQSCFHILQNLVRTEPSKIGHISTNYLARYYTIQNL